MLWVALAEKAYVEINECGWIRPAGLGGGQNVYTDISSGDMSWPLGQVTGQATIAYEPTFGSTAFTTLAAAFNAGKSSLSGFAQSASEQPSHRRSRLRSAGRRYVRSNGHPVQPVGHSIWSASRWRGRTSRQTLTTSIKLREGCRAAQPERAIRPLDAPRLGTGLKSDPSDCGKSAARARLIHHEVARLRAN